MVDQSLLLAELGRRLRAARRARGLSVAELARLAGTSRRHVTEAEAGRANLSLLKLAALAEALSAPLGELCDLTPGVARGERVALVGLRGAGKSTVGRLLARDLEMPFVELDRRVEELAGLDLGALFDLRGAAGFHAAEAEALEQVLASGERLVLATGGSVVESPETFERLRVTCHTVWLRAAPEAHHQRVLAQGDRRPTRDHPRAMEELRAILRRRTPAYARCAHSVDTDGRTPAEVARAVRDALGL